MILGNQFEIYQSGESSNGVDKGSPMAGHWREYDRRNFVKNYLFFGDGS